MDPITTFTAPLVALPMADIDTDQIIPARFLKTTTQAGLGASLFADWRYAPGGAPRPEFVLNRPEAQGAGILVAGPNFGCGSSREHAPWALLDYGFRAVVSTAFADIFRNNALKNGLLPIAVDAATHAALLQQIAARPGAQATVDLVRQTLILPDGQEARFPIDPFAHHCLLQGLDQLGFLLAAAPAIAAYEAAHPARVCTVEVQAI
ncbi:MAG TPA: 3-isopropylmalate dehydratase small subunit [Chloroflexia bacterium]|nr:3-isopropylmalate dehydratase small subunit [Chloroflexia bacterium]